MENVSPIRIFDFIRIIRIMFFIYTFYISLAAIALMLAFKLLESHRGEIGWWQDLVRRADKRVHDMRAKLVAKYRLYKKIAYLFVFEFLPAYAYRQTVRLKDY